MIIDADFGGDWKYKKPAFSPFAFSMMVTFRDLKTKESKKKELIKISQNRLLKCNALFISRHVRKANSL